MRLDEVVRALDAYFRVPDVENDDWSPEYEQLYPDPYWREFAEPGYEGRWNGLLVRGGAEVERAATCVFPSDAIVATLAPRTFLFSEHPIAFEDDVEGFAPLARATFERMRSREVTFYHVHAPLDMHPEVSPSRLVAEGLGLEGLEEYYPIADGIPGGAAVVGESRLTLDDLAGRLRTLLGEEIPVEVLTRPRRGAGRVAVVAGGGADADILRASLERGCRTFVTGNAATRCRLSFVQEGVREFRVLASEADVAVVDATHYGLEKPPQLAMVGWFERLGLPARFIPGRPERGV
ncbi:MAG TPA: Nif3-like dinuclear metal center hexameric protein [Gaiellaceae bacterium]|nr:Nif3-like dinuclear metal center hexameric protein [Gaiellaceae bacterium]